MLRSIFLTLTILSLSLNPENPQWRTEAFKKAPDAADYPVVSIYEGSPADPILDSKRAHLFRTRIRDGSKQGPNFAGHYTMVLWGCGLGSFSMAVVDARSGKVHFPPFECVELSHYNLPLPGAELLPAFRIDSRLIVFYGVIDKKEWVGYHYYTFDNGTFRRVHFIPDKDRTRRKAPDA